MDIEEVKNWLRNNEDDIGLQNLEVEEVKSGESNHNIILNSDSGKYVLRISRKVSRRNRLENESKSLKLLQEEEISQVPRQKYFSEETPFGPVIIEDFIGEKDLERAHMLEDEQIKSLAELLGKTHSIDIEKYNQVFEEEARHTKNLREIYEEEFERWSKIPYEEYLEIVDEPRDDLEKYYERQKDLVEEVPDAEVPQSFIHSDLGFNLRTKNSETVIVDWEYGTSGYAGHDLMILFEHGQLNDEQREKFLKEYRKYRDLGSEFSKVRDIHPGFLAFHDAVWAAKRVEQEQNKEERKEILKRKLDKLETFYKNRK
jgi:aminoglycoside phosphotransferase (APT) family kinase protein